MALFIGFGITRLLDFDLLARIKQINHIKLFCPGNGDLDAYPLLRPAMSRPVTVGANVPLNDHLAAAGDPARIADPAAVRDHFQAPWIAWNVARTVLATAALGCLGRALVLHGRRRPTR